ncbi:Fe-S cluster assembly scaffold IscU [Candidatus Cytomitobacter indipagum]|uniref:Fe-S cluster assembly scaffold IscU n=1 Tax=Candidatus Cytomitobacter indipagum TaxID=2601575 RepID=A0A5C0UFJ2_9PROT|nr:iron-sulfur cluster assembly scaffold protein [Candidatus Cytomitobacter indipagum]QEK37824.1 Fe-S cluster assembly scaffold IscU [Candidatus Cytomitobacter indipagum]
MNRYNEKINEAFRNPKNVGSMDETDDNVGVGFVGSPGCGDVLKIYIKVDDSDRIADVKFKTFGCGSAIASSSVLTEKVMGLTLEEAKKITNKDIADELSLPAIKTHCSVLAEEAITDAIENLISKRLIKKGKE